MEKGIEKGMEKGIEEGVEKGEWRIEKGWELVTAGVEAWHGYGISVPSRSSSMHIYEQISHR